MTVKQAIKVLKKHNNWRRGGYSHPQDPKIIGEGKTVIEAKSDFLNSFYWMEQRCRERGEEFPRNVSINFYEV